MHIYLMTPCNYGALLKGWCQLPVNVQQYGMINWREISNMQVS